MHAILSLGAAHLHAQTTLELKETVERHRTRAMQGLMVDEDLSRKDEDAATRLTARLATAYSLTFAASYMGDSLGLFLVLVRACASLTRQIVQSGYTSPLLPWKEDSGTSAPHLEVMKRRLRKAPPLSVNDISEAKVSFDLVEKHCAFVTFQWKLLQTMKAVIGHINEPYDGECVTIRLQ